MKNINLKNRNLLTLADFTREEITYLLDLSAKLKANKKAGKEIKQLVGKNIALIFEKDSTRTRCAFEVAAFDQGAHVTYLGPTGSHIGTKESAADTSRVLGRLYDGIQYRGFSQSVVEEMGASEALMRVPLEQSIDQIRSFGAHGRWDLERVLQRASVHVVIGITAKWRISDVHLVDEHPKTPIV